MVSFENRYPIGPRFILYFIQGALDYLPLVDHECLECRESGPQPCIVKVSMSPSE